MGKQENCASPSACRWRHGIRACRLLIVSIYQRTGRRIPNGGKKAEVPEEVEFQTKPAIALDQIRASVEADVPLAWC